MSGMGETLLDRLLRHGRETPDRAALVAADRVVTYRQFVALVADASQRLDRAGVRKGDRVVLQAPNSVDLAVAYFAVHGAGGIVVPVDNDASANTLRNIVADADPALVVDAEPARTDRPHRSLDEIVTPGAIDASGDANGLRPPDAGDVADILYTTGTTGHPRGVVLTHANIVGAARNTSTFLLQREDDVEVVPVPLSHSFGLGRLRCMAFVGSTLVPVPGVRIPAEMVGAIAKHRATGFAMVPAGIALLRRAGRDLLETVVDQLRYVEIASAAIAPDVRDWLLDTLPKTRVMHSYGLTEASRACVVDLRSEVGRRGSIGFASPNVEIEIHDATNRRVAAGVEGEIHVRGAMIMREYWRQPEKTSEVLRDGWLRTGDMAYMEANGAIHLRGRSSDMINVGGMKVAPDEVERLLLEHPDVTDAACVGIADSKGISGERVKAFVVCKKSVDPGALLEWIRGRGLETYKVPVAVEESVSIPRTQNGKILRRLLKG